MATCAVACFTLLFLMALWNSHYCTVPVPQRPPGFVYKEAEVNAMAPIQMEAYIDLICKDARAAFPVYLEVAEVYGPQKLRLSLVMFPLPYHPHAFWASAATFFVNTKKPDSTFDYIKAVYGKYELISTRATMNSSSDALIQMFGDIAADFGVPAESVVEELNTNEFQSLKKAVFEWKYACSRGAYGTPNVFVNGVFVTNNQSWTVNDWKTVLDPMVY